MPDDRHRLAPIDVERYVTQNPVLVVICKPYVLKFDLAATFPVNVDRLCRIYHDRLGVDQLEQALRARHRRLQNVVLLAHVRDGPEEALRVLNEGRQSTKS